MKKLVLSTLIFLSFSLLGQNNYIEQLANGDVRYSVTYSQAQAYVEVFVKKNSAQIIAQNIVSSQVANANGTFSYSLVKPASGYAIGDQLQTRFYSYAAGQPGVFIPGPDQSVWSNTLFYGVTPTCNANQYITELSNGTIQFSVEFASAKAYVEIFIKKNGTQILAQAITSSQTVNTAGKYVYSYLLSASNAVSGDKFLTRFYSYGAGQPGEFTPGPTESVWSSEFTYHQSCENVVYVSVSGSDVNSGSKTSPVRTVTKALDLASVQGKTLVKISQGTYEEGNLNVQNGVSVEGGYNSDYSVYNPSLYVTTIDANQPTGYYVCGSKRIFRAENITLPTTIKGLTMTRGRMCAYGGGMYIKNCNENFVVKENIITGNSSVGNGSSAGGNIYIESSNCKIFNNTITNGFAGASLGNDIYLLGTNNGNVSEIAYNTITSVSSIYGNYYGYLHDNTFLYSYRSVTNETLENEYMPLELQVKGSMLYVHTSETSTNIQLYDLSGKLQQSLEATELDLSNLNSGIYVVRVKSGEMHVTEKIVR